MTEDEFHRARRMFVLGPDGVLILAGRSDSRSHSQWFADQGWPKALEEWPRGYFNSRGVYIYRGLEFRAVDLETVKVICRRLDTRMQRTGERVGLLDAEVYSGMLQQAFVGQWLPRVRCGKLCTLLTL